MGYISLMEETMNEVFLELGRGVEWGERKLEEVVEIHDRGRKPVRETDRIRGNVPYCGANGVIDYVEGYTHEGEFVLLAEDGGKFGAGEKSAYFMSGKFWANNHVHILCGKSGVLETRYLLFALNYLDLTPYLTGTTRPKLTQRALRKIPVPLPYPDDPQRSLAEQRRIVTRLEMMLTEVREMRATIREMREDVDRLMEAVLEEVFSQDYGRSISTWGIVTLRDIAEEESSQISPSDKPEAVFNYWGLDAIQKGQMDEPPPNYVLGAKIRGTCVRFDQRHVLYAKLRPYLKKVIVPSVEGIGSTEWIVLRPKSELVDRKYLGFALRTRKFVEYVSASSVGTRMPRARKETFWAAEIPLPYPDNPERSLAEQRRIVERLEAIYQEIGVIKKLLDQDEQAVNQLEQSILAAAFRGEI